MSHLTIEETACQLRVSTQMIRRWLAESKNDFPRPVRVRKRILFEADQVEKYLKDHRVK